MCPVDERLVIAGVVGYNLLLFRVNSDGVDDKGIRYQFRNKFKYGRRGKRDQRYFEKIVPNKTNEDGFIVKG